MLFWELYDVNAMRNRLLLFLLLSFPLAIAQTASQPPADSSSRDQAETLIADRGTATFTVSTNMPGITVKGKSEALHARAEIRRTADGLIVDRLEASLPIKTLATGIAVRDQHMREYIFTTPSGDLPDLRFAAANASCPGVQPGREVTCMLSGTLSIRGTVRNFSIPLKIREASGAPAFRATGDAVVKLSDYGIEAPSQFGVRTANEIHIHLEVPETAAGTLSAKSK